MPLNKRQVVFLSAKLGIDNFNPSLMSPLELWQLRERLIDYECDDEACGELIDVAASLVDYMSKLPDDYFPREWRLKSPPEVEALLANVAPDRVTQNDSMEAQKMLHYVPA